MKTNREKNQEHDTRAKARVRPAPKEWNHVPLENAIRAMVLRAQVLRGPSE